MNPEVLHTPIVYLRGVGTQRAELLKNELGIHQFQDLLNLFPNRYIDRTRFYKISELQNNSAEVQIVGKIIHLKTVSSGNNNRLVATFTDDISTMELVWFKGIKWLRDTLKINEPYVIYGKINWFNGAFSMPHPEMDLVADFNQTMGNTIQPVYPSTEKLSKRGVTNRVIRQLMQNLFQDVGKAFYETLPHSILSSLNLISKSEALVNIHFPKSQELLGKAQMRLKFEELFYIQLQLVRKNILQKQRFKGFTFDKVGEVFSDFYNNRLPFDLTQAQKRVLKEIRNDVGSNAQMNRLLQGDVGSGKTIVALMAMLLAIDNGFQACLMAPTEILASQHFQSISELLEGSSVTIALLTGSTKNSQRKIIDEQLQEGSLQILVGTHALLEDKVKFKNLGFAIIDEQHRFGVEQRSKLWKKNHRPPHILVMTATPIPRTLAMSVYGDLDISIIDELPPGRKPIQTVHRYENHRAKVYEFIKKEIDQGRQAYVVYPLIEESESLDFKNLTEGFEYIENSFPRPKYQISMVHGRMKPAEKDAEMEKFKQGITQIMVATTVIEVGVNVPNASVMVIESAERFGLSQLHQLRGRVGRGNQQSYCILLTGNKLGSDSLTRMQTMTQTNDGFQIAEVDLKLRGPGDLMGTQQSGVLALKIADLVKDQTLLRAARAEAIQLLKSDPELKTPENRTVAYTLHQLHTHKNIWTFIS
ncbi:ATP-dependent DNA helicase RecG [Capnocytophaga canimorsus]|uniref:ATP-dependent DNA helicase RecG n=1 Tax=Capnocytophaga canimorsus TaxID=28188 RepID=A0A0B7H6H1_9FLAO|nr:ATP-dependent DNA helicase RecG [Capnocytophaga canimorsus]ATA76572.1 DNA helicase RecG [Capnocytophaga canimorsus]ATA93299.1 DNA helicase RecG [Capnocytophaga canimorsus]PJI77032.1 ATP-dependent DNA helicase RecG [Capnocytophaga canimorsus]CEN34990.1 ATP-dependent DNA helicase RecG [Capnocytophaga canimorsus]STA71736.1 ATP-dependent DNA helicase recG [Capnocytophaga canimorsus]